MALLPPQRGSVCISSVLWSNGVMEKTKDKTSGIPSDISLHRLFSSLRPALQYSFANF
ncbi:MAG: hypothetical protein JRI43_02005 [Deltaproteobacteria bacterium]|nr:hypothetical protein [Deltaproteobacteria bacterium]